MPALGILGLVALAVVLVLAALAPKTFAAETPPPTGPGIPRAEPAPQLPPLTRAQLADRLQKLADAPAPTNLGPGASCYRRAAPPQTAEYVCPIDGSHTHYAKGAALAERVNQLPQLRQAAKDLPGVTALIDESEFCRKCMPKEPASPEPILIVKLADGSEKRTRGVSWQDLNILREFLTGKVKHEGDQGGESPLKDKLPRIRALLGMPSQE